MKTGGAAHRLLHMRICICEDQDNQIASLKALLADHEVTVYHSAEEMLFECGTSFPFDLCLLDVNLDKMNGVMLARKIRETDEAIVLAFVTNLNEYMAEGYEVQAARYLLKPVTKEKIEELLAFVRRKKIARPPLIVSVKGELLKFEQDDILYFESVGHYVRIRTQTGSVELKGKLSDFIEGRAAFVPTHRSYAVNLDKVKKIGKGFCVVGEEEIPLSRQEAKSFCRKFIDWNKEKL